MTTAIVENDPTCYKIGDLYLNVYSNARGITSIAQLGKAGFEMLEGSREIEVRELLRQAEKNGTLSRVACTHKGVEYGILIPVAKGSNLFGHGRV